MGILRAKVTNEGGWWEARLLDLNIAADGASEADLLRALSYTIAAEYHIAIANGQTPFFNLMYKCPKEVSESWEDGGKQLRNLELPNAVRAALSAAFMTPMIAEFQIEPTDNNYANAA